MKKSILIIATVVFGLLNANATTVNKNLNSTNVSVDITKENIVEVFDWTVKTINGEYSGTSTSLFEAKKMVNISTRGENIQDITIESYFVMRSELNNKKSRIYYWEVESSNGLAKGFSKSETSAELMIKLVAKGDIISFKIVKS